MNETIIHRAPWVIPVSQPPIADGAVAVRDTEIIDTGPFESIVDRHPASGIREHNGSVLLPALINAHIHLELSHIDIPKKHAEIAGFTDWIEKLLETRERTGAVGETVEKAAAAVLMQQYNQGIIGLGDIGNTDIAEQLSTAFPGILLHFNEVLGRSSKSRRSILQQIEQADKAKIFTAHAPYSTHAELIKALKIRSKSLQQPFSIHVAEPPSEVDLLTRASGELFNFLVRHQFIDKSFKAPAAIDKPGSVQYLHMLGVLDSLTICVHCIHVSPQEIKILAETKTNICLCPGSNRYLNVGRAPVKQFLDSGLRPCLGTDSSASNPELSLWREMRILQEDNPQVPAAEIVRMATLGGAVALGIGNDYGSLEPGKKARFLTVRLPDELPDPEAVYGFLIKNNMNIKPGWV